MYQIRRSVAGINRLSATERNRKNTVRYRSSAQRSHFGAHQERLPPERYRQISHLRSNVFRLCIFPKV